MIRSFLLALATCAIATSGQAQIPNTIDCSGFEKTDYGWYAKPTNPPFDLDDKTQVVIQGAQIGPGLTLYDYDKEYYLGGKFKALTNQRNPVDLYAALQAKCGP